MLSALKFLIASTAVANIFLGLVVLRRSKSASNITFASFAFLTSLWNVTNVLVLFNPTPLNVRLTYAVGPLVMAASLSWVLVFTRVSAKKGLIGSYLLGLMAFGLGLTPLVVKRIISYSVSGQNVVYGSLYPVYSAWLLITLIVDLLILFYVKRKETYLKKSQIRFVILGIFLFGAIALTASAFLPLLGIRQFMMLDSPCSLFFVGFSAYAIVKHRLMDIRVLVLKSVAYSLLVAIVAGVYISLAYLFLQKYPGIVSPNVLTVLALVVVVFGAFPLRRFIERTTDKIFAKGRYNPQELLRKLGEVFSTKVILEDLTKATLKTLVKEMRLRRAAFIVTASPEIRDVKQIGYKGVSKYNWEKAVSLAKNKREMIVADELEETSKEKELLRKLNTEVLLPLSTENEMVGLLALGEKSSGDMFTLEDLRLLEVIAPQAAIALENATLVKERDIRIAELDALNNLALSLGSTLSLDQILDQVIEEALRVTGAEDGSIMLLDEETQTLQVKCARGIEPEVSKKARTKLGEGIAGFVAGKAQPTLIINGRHENEYLESCLKRADINSALAVPLKAKEKVIGVLNVNRKKKREVFTKENLDLITSFAAQAAEAIENAKLYEDLQETFFGTISSLAAAVDAKDHYTYGHSEAVTRHTIDIAKEMKLPEEEIKNLEVAGKLHDIGKIGIDEKILNKPGKLTEEERKIINEHPKIAVDILKSVPSLKDIIPYILYHHERYDGKGYPAGLADDIIPLGARILAVADSFNAMRTDRPYRPALSLEEATQELKKCSGTQFDPQVVQAFLRVLEKNKPLKVVEGGRKNRQNSKKANHFKVLAGK